jgi:hypothetical protein
MNDFKAPGAFLDSDLDSRTLLNPAPIQYKQSTYDEGLNRDKMINNPRPSISICTTKNVENRLAEN